LELVSTELTKMSPHQTTRKSAKPKQKVLGLKNHTFDIGNVEYTSKYKKMVSAIANHIQRGV
jgi:hypothetical protein